MKITYCKQWFRAQKRELDSFTARRARAAYDARELYTAVIAGEHRPVCFVESQADYIGVDFLDDCLRSYVAYQFAEKGRDQLFLTMAVYRRFEGDSDKVVHGVVYFFKESGQLHVDQEDYATQESHEASTTVDVTPNWEPYPAFGQYESISRLDRGLQLIH